MIKKSTYLSTFVEKSSLFIFLFLLVFTILNSQNEAKNCFESNDYYDQASHDALEIFTQDYIAQYPSNASSRGKITIPVVVHIVYPTENENISNAQVFSQIDALNRDFNRRNDNLDKVHPDFENIIGKVGFNFCLATIDPDGNVTDGITRTATNENFEYSRGAKWIYHTADGGHTAWDTNQYLNIWVTKTGSNIAGFGSKPNQNQSDEDGVIISVDYFGQLGTALPNFQLGRTGTHEVAHYFNIFHPFNDGCDGDDFVADVPQQSNSYNGNCLADENISCGGRDNASNFMNYAQDECLAMFSQGQALRMQAALIHARSGLLNNNACQQSPTPTLTDEIKIYPNPASYYFCIEVGDAHLPQIPYIVFNALGQKIEEGIVLPNSLQHFPTYRNGIYFIQFMDGSAEGVLKKIIINN